MKTTFELISVVLTLSTVTRVNACPTETVLSGTENTDSAVERIVTNIEDVYDGVTLDYSYRECGSRTLWGPGSDGLCSVPGCPKSDEGIPWIYYGIPPKCYLAGERGPCELNERLKIVKESPYGICHCDCFEGIIKRAQPQKIEFCKSYPTEFVFVAEAKRCFSLFAQGPCKPNEWLVKSHGSNSTEVTCETRKCPEGQIPLPLTSDSQNVTCYQELSLGAGFASVASILPNDCQENQRYSTLLKRCIEKLSFNLY